MQKEFVTYEIAEGLSDLGFNQACLSFYHDKSEDNQKVNRAGEFISLAGWSEGRHDKKAWDEGRNKGMTGRKNSKETVEKRIETRKKNKLNGST
jgi:hypothetical protein